MTNDSLILKYRNYGCFTLYVALTFFRGSLRAISGVECGANSRYITYNRKTQFYD